MINIHIYTKIRQVAANVVTALLICIPAAAQQNLDNPVLDSHGHIAESSPTNTRKSAIAPSFAWKLLSPLGLRKTAPIDTLPLNYYIQSIPSMASTAYATTGNLGAEGMNMIFSERAPMSDFFFRDGLYHWLPSHDKMRFYNTRIPMTLLSFNSSGGKETSQERLQGTFSGNINSKAQVGAMVDYLYSKGSYANQALKSLTWGFSGSYLGDRYEMQAYYYHFNSLNKEKGGITDMLYITDPAELQGGVTSIDPKSIPTKLSYAHTRVRGGELYINNRYKIGYWQEEEIDDSTTYRTYIPVSSIIYTLRYNDNKHSFIDYNAEETAEYFSHTYLNPEKTYDFTTNWALTNTLGVSLLEGFHKYAKFGLAAYITHQVRRYNQTPDSLDRSDPGLVLDPFPENIGEIAPHTTQQLAWIGGQLTKQRGEHLRYQATAELGILGDVAGDIKVDGEVSTRFPLMQDSLQIKAFGAFHNIEAPYLTKKYISNHYAWNNDFGKRRTASFGGQIDFGPTDTHFRASVSNLQNHIYFGSDGLPKQNSGSVQVLSLSLRQNLKLGILHWDNKITYQTSSDQEVIPLPKLAVYSNLYLLFNIATLNVQLGMDCDYYTRYNAPTYLPALAAFGNQNEYKVGNYPFCNVYLNCKLSKTRFYVMYSHANKGLFGGNEYFSMPFYPLNPSRLQIGLSIDFTN